MEKEKACGLHCTKINNISVTIGKQEILKNINIHIHCRRINGNYRTKRCRKKYAIKSNIR